jgi:aminopeptidase N
MAKDATPGTIYLKEYQPPEYLIEEVELEFDLQQGGTLVTSTLFMRSNPESENSKNSLFLHGEELELLDIELNGLALSESDYKLSDEGLTLLQPPERFELKTVSRIYPENNTALEGLYQSGQMYCSQCEAEGFRKITWFLDRPDVMAKFSTRIIADREKFPVLLSNGNPGDFGILDETRHFAQWHDPFPKPSYLFALVAGDLEVVSDTYQTVSGHEVGLNIYVEKENLDKCDHAMRSLINAMQWDEQVYGREYDLDVFNIVAVNDFNMGAMENKGLNIFNAKYVLAKQDTATDADFQGIEAVIAHEYFHNWTGNRITCRDWFQLSLKEGFTVYRDQSFSADMGDASVKRIEDVRLLRAHQFSEDAGPMAHPVRPDSYIEINNFYTVTVYEKGAEVVRMQANLLGPELFRKATDLYFEKFDGQAVTTEDFVGCMEAASGYDLKQFKHWYDFAGTPVVKVETDYDPDQQKYRMTFSQHCPDTPGQTDKPPFHIPFEVGLLNAQGHDLLEDGMLELRDRQQVFEFDNIESKPVPSLLRGFTAPVKLEYDYSDQELLFLMANDPDGFACWDAAQSLTLKILMQMVADHNSGSAMNLPDEFINAFRSALLNDARDKALTSEILTLPTASYIGEQMEIIDVDGIHAARQSMKQQLAEALYEDLLMVYNNHREQGDYSISHGAIARRSLKNRVLSYLASIENDEVGRLCVDQYHAANNMTDVMAAFTLIADSDFSQRLSIIADFEANWRHDVLVMDKWFSAQAISTRSDTLERVVELKQHPLFSISNPNKVRSLIGAFCSANMMGFHQANGDGYRLLADTVLQLDKLNPQIASRMSRLMSKWHRFDSQRQALMKAELERIVSADDVSRDVYEIVSKTLK